MSGRRYTAEECTLGLEAYIAIRNSNSSFSITNPILINLKKSLEEDLDSSRSIDSLAFLALNFRYQDEGKGCPNISQTALNVWRKYLNEKSGDIDEDRLMADCRTIRKSFDEH